MPNHNASIELCVQKLRILIEDSDQNLKYLRLLAMSKILTTHPKSVQAHKDLIMRCLDDKDESIRLRALDLLYGMVGKKNLMEIVKKLMVHMEKAEGTTYRDELLTKIIQICCQNNYQHITNFEWYISVLVELSRVEGLSHGHLVASQMLDVAVRVHAIRPFAVQQMSLLLENPYIFFGVALGSVRTPSMIQVLYAAAWICGEYCTFLSNPRKTLMAMLDPLNIKLPHNIQAVYLQNCLKILAHLLPSRSDGKKPEVLEEIAKESGEKPVLQNGDKTDSNDNETIIDEGGGGDKIETINGSNAIEEQDKLPEETIKVVEVEEELNLPQIQEFLLPFVSSEELEVQERAGCLNNFIKCYLKLEGKGQAADIIELSSELAQAFSSELNPVAVKAQKKVPVPEGLDLDAWINDPPSDSEEETTDTTDVFVESPAVDFGTTSESKKKVYEPTEEELTRMRETRMQEQELNPHYLKGSTASKKPISNGPEDDLPPIEKLDLNIDLKVPAFASSDKYLLESKNKERKKDKAKKKKKKRTKKENKESEEEEVEEPEPEAPLHVVNTIIEMPEGATISDTEDSPLSPDDPHRALDIDLDIPIEEPEPIKTKKPRKSDPNYLKKTKKEKKNEEVTNEVEVVVDIPVEQPLANSKKSKSSSSETKSHKKHKKKEKKEKSDKKEKKSKKSKEKQANDENLLVEIE